MTMALPANLSIIVTNYNKPVSQINECMASIREQTVSPKEVILVDDGSSDPHAHRDALSIVSPKNLGVAKARDLGVRMSTGKLLLFLDADDKLSPDFIQQCGKVILNCDIAYSNILLFGEINRNHLMETPAELRPEHLFPKSCAIRVTSMMYRHVYEKLNGFREMEMFEDWDFWLRAMCNGYTFKKANTLLMYRQNLKSRNRASSDLKSKVIRDLAALYQIKDGRLVEKEEHGE